MSDPQEGDIWQYSPVKYHKETWLLLVKYEDRVIKGLPVFKALFMNSGNICDMFFRNNKKDWTRLA